MTLVKLLKKISEEYPVEKQNKKINLILKFYIFDKVLF